jgi:hypothetical protein
MDECANFLMALSMLRNSGSLARYFFSQPKSRHRDPELMSDEIELGLRVFLTTHVRSVTQLELILLLHNRPQQGWNAADAARKFGLAPEMTLELLRTLCEQGIAASEDSVSYCYAPKSLELERQIDQLAALYQQRRVSLVQLIYRPEA